MERIIFHIDVNNAFLSWTAVYLLKNGYKEDIRDIPSVIGGDECQRKGIVLAKSMIAKKYGIVTAETIYQAKKKCPNLQVFSPNYDLYLKCSNELYKYLTKYTDRIERYSIDECFLDMTGTNYLYNNYVLLANKIKNDIKQKFGYTVNIGLASNKLCAKMASDFQKPNLVHTLFGNEIETKLWPLSVNELFMIGKQTNTRLLSLGINTIKDLAFANTNLLKKYFKSFAIVMKEYANGVDNSEVIKEQGKSKCISVSQTLVKDTKNINELKKTLYNEVLECTKSLRKQGLYTTVIAVTFKNSDFLTYSHQKKLESGTASNSLIYQEIVELFLRGWRKDVIRSIGVRLSDFISYKNQQLSIFGDDLINNNEDIDNVIDSINDKYGNNIIIPASLKITKNSVKK